MTFSLTARAARNVDEKATAAARKRYSLIEKIILPEDSGRLRQGA
jgi:hypothetical protein